MGRSAKRTSIPVCPYCGLNAELVDGLAVYRKSYGMLWICQPCQAWVGVHKDSKSNKPLGTLANAELRKLRSETHKAFDPFWEALAASGRIRSKARHDTYRKLAVELGIATKQCHVAQFDEVMCRKSLEICAGWKRAAAEATAQRDSPLPG